MRVPSEGLLYLIPAITCVWFRSLYFSSLGSAITEQAFQPFHNLPPFGAEWLSENFILIMLFTDMTSLHPLTAVPG